MRIVMVAMVMAAVRIASAGPLEPHKGSTATASFPKGWVVQENQGVFAAQQDPARDDAAAILLLYAPNASNATEDQLLDTIASQISKDLAVVERAGVKGGRGHYLIGDGTADGIKIRVGGVALVINGQAMVSVLAAKTSEFAKLGGLELATQVLASIEPAGAAAAPPPATSSKLVMGVPSRAVTVADLAGDWSQDNSVVTSYASSSNGRGGYMAASASERWRIEASGVIYTKLSATTSSSRGMTYQFNEKAIGGISISADGVMTITHKKGEGSTAMYFIRGWGATKDLSVMQLNGPYYGEQPDVARLRRDPQYASNLNEYWARPTP